MEEIEDLQLKPETTEEENESQCTDNLCNEEPAAQSEEQNATKEPIEQDDKECHNLPWCSSSTNRDDTCSTLNFASDMQNEDNTLVTVDTIGKHISIQKELAHLEALVDQSDDQKKQCPLCPEDRFKSCHITKLLRHLQNLHWKVSVEFEGYRMCICCLHCLENTGQNENELPSKTSAHYHCIICSGTARRRMDMIRHIKRHVNNGETQLKPTSVRPQEILHEANTEVQVLPNCSIPQKSGTFFNPVMKTNRQLIFCALSVLTEERKPLECLDAFSATGIMGLQWAKHLGNSVKVTLNDITDSATAVIRENCHLNQMKVLIKGEEKSDTLSEENDVEDFVSTVEVTQMDANILMHTRSFDFIHLDPFGTSVNYLDAAFRNIRNLGIVSVTSTDTGSLYAKTVHVAKRHYGCNIIRTEYFKELAVRVVLAAVARAAARCNKGIEVLLSVAVEHFVLVIVRILRGPSLADESIKMINNLIHCHWCEERIFQKEGNMLEENPYKQLPCDCHKSMPGRSAALLGPIWSGPLFNTGFLRRMLFVSSSRGIAEIQTLLKNLICESECTIVKQFSAPFSSYSQEESGILIKVPGAEALSDSGKRKRQDITTNLPKRLKSDARPEPPPFYYSIHRHAIGGLNIPKLNKILQYLSEAGFLVSRTHFDPTGIRTNAPLATLKAILQQNSSLTNTSQSSSHKDTTEAPQEEELPVGEAASVSDTK